MDINRWFNSLEKSLETPRSFLLGIKSRIVEDSQSSTGFKYFITYNPNRERRKELMENFQQKLFDQGIKISCHLCYQLDKPLISIFNKKYLLQEIPNKFPLLVGHSLLVNRKHNIKGDLPIIITKNVFEELQKISAEQEINIGRNHVEAGMSIKDHEHFHFLPRGVLKTDEGNFDWEPTSGYEISEFGEPFYRVKDSIFADLAIKGKSCCEIAGKLQENLISSKIIYVVNTTPDLINFAIRKDSLESQRHGYGISYGVNFVAQNREEFENVTRNELEKKAIDCVYLREKFDWSPFLEKVL